MRILPFASTAVIAAGAAALPGTANAAAPAVPGIMVHDAGSPTHIVTFRSVACRTSGRVMKAEARAAGWRLRVQLNAFNGFHTYNIQRGFGPNNFWLDRPGAGFTNIITPDVPLPPIGGAVTFPSGRTRMGLGYINAWSSTSNDKAVTIAGQALCRWPVIPRRRP